MSNSVDVSATLDSLTTEIYVVDGVFCFLALVVVFARVWVRLRVVRAGWGWDDWTIVLAMVLTIFLSYFTAMSAYHGFGSHILSTYKILDQLPFALKNYYFAEIFYIAVVTVTKLSICLFYLRLLVDPSFRRTVIIVILLLLLCGISTEIAVVLQCIPIDYNWRLMRFIDLSLCFNVKAFWTANGIINIISDLIVYILPMPMLWKVNRPQKQRVALVLVFAVGLFVVLAGIVRFAYVRLALQSVDIFYTNGPVLMWSCIEISVGLICACLPSLKPLVSRVIPRFTWTYGSGRSHSRSGHHSVGKEFTPHGSRRRASEQATSNDDTGRSSKREVGESSFGRWSGESETDFHLEIGIAGVSRAGVDVEMGERDGSEAGLRRNIEGGEDGESHAEGYDERDRIEEIDEGKEHKAPV